VHKASKKIVEYCLSNGIGTIVIGQLNKGITNIDIGKQNNQKLHQMPYGKFIEKLKYKDKGKWNNGNSSKRIIHITNMFKVWNN